LVEEEMLDDVKDFGTRERCSSWAGLGLESASESAFG
jgi:hypothetical protein